MIKIFLKIRREREKERDKNVCKIELDNYCNKKVLCFFFGHNLVKILLQMIMKKENVYAKDQQD